MGYPLYLNAPFSPAMFRMVLSSDHVTPATGLAPTVLVSVNTGAFGAPAFSVNEVGEGWYAQTIDASLLGSQGVLLLSATAATADPVGEAYPIFGVNLNDPQRAGLTALPAVNAGSAGGIVTSGTGTGQLKVTAGLVELATASITAILTGTALAESYPADGASGTLAQLLYLLLANLGQVDVAGTSMVARKLDGITAAATYLLNDALNPTSRTRTG